MELTPTLQWIHRIYVTVFRELSNLLQVTFQNGRFIVAMLALLTRKSSIISPDTSLLKNILHAVCKLLCAKFCVVTKNLSYFLSSAANDLRQIQLYGGPWTSTSWDNGGGGGLRKSGFFFRPSVWPKNKGGADSFPGCGKSDQTSSGLLQEVVIFNVYKRTLLAKTPNKP